MFLFILLYILSFPYSDEVSSNNLKNSDFTDDIINDCDIIYWDSVIRYNLGNDIIEIRINGKSSDKYILINLHENEVTSINAAKEIIDNFGGYFIYISQSGERNIKFTLDSIPYAFDPNRIFTREGIKKTLHNLGNFSLEAENEVFKFANYLLDFLTKDSVCIIAVHNNYDGNYSAKSYYRKNKQDAKRVYINPSEDVDDFFFVVQERDFDFFKSQGYNVVLQDNENVNDDGSLSVYCGKNNIRYINVEVQEGKLQTQYKMILSAINYLSEK